MKGRLVIKLTGPAVKDGRLDAKDAATLLASVQEALDRLAKAKGIPLNAVKLRLESVKGNANDPEDRR